MRLIYPVLWSRLGRDACQEQTANTVAALARHGLDITLVVPQGARDPVVAVDTFDTNSVAALERGADVPIHYSAADPRQAQIDGATRTYYWKNLTSFGILIVGIGGLLLLGWWRVRRRTARSTMVGS